VNLRSGKEDWSFHSNECTSLVDMLRLLGVFC
jgi:hypothetical protein